MRNVLRRTPSRGKTVLFSAITIGLSIAFSFVVIEYGLVKYYGEIEEHTPETAFDLVLGWKPTSGSRWVKPAHTFRAHTISINQWGLRNREITAEKQNGVRRIVVLGDSFTFGKAVQTSDIFPSILETRLNQTNRFEVINAGVPGYGSAQELLLMRELAAKGIDGDVYLLMVFLNDILDNLRLDYEDLSETLARPGFALQKDGELKQVTYPRKEYSTSLLPSTDGRGGFVTLEVVKRQLATFVQSRPRLARLITKLGFEQKMPRMPGVINGWYHKEVLDAGIPLTRALMRDIQFEARKQGAILLVSMIPSAIQVYPDVYDPILKSTFSANKTLDEYLGDRMRPQRTVASICRELDVPFLDLLPILLSSNDEELYIPLDGHFTTEGHAIVAKYLSTFIEKNTSALPSRP